MSKISVVLPVMTDGKPFLRSLTEHCIKTMRAHADNPFELIVVEAGKPYFNVPTSTNDPELYFQGDFAPDKHLSFNPPIGGVREINAGIRAASGDFIVFVGNDITAPPHWDTELRLPFEKFKDCGISALSVKEGGALIGPPVPVDLIHEGMFSAFCMFRKGWEYDESYLRIYQDSDLVLRMYQAGLRAYRNCRAIAHHMGAVTNETLSSQHTDAHNKQVAKDEAFFYNRWEKCPYFIFGMMRGFQLTFGREYEAWLKPIFRHE